MQTKIETRTSLNHLRYLPSFAQYLLLHRLNELAQVQLQIGEEADIPLMRLLKEKPLEQRLAIVTESLTELLTHLSQNQAGQQIENALRRWKEDQLQFAHKDDIVAEDITLVTYLRKRFFLHFLPDYSSSTEQMIELIREIDLFLLESETAFTNFYMDLLKTRIDEHSHFIEKITNTSPGIIYVYDVLHNKEIYANRTTADLLGYQPKDITAMGSKFVETLIHPDDLAMLKQYEEEFKTTRDGEVRSFNYRIRNNKGEYRWLRTFETVFKRNAAGEISEKIGIAIDVHRQKLIADALRQREAELLEAQEIAQLGSFIWSFEQKTLQGSPQTKKILETDLNDTSSFLNKIHSDDMKKVKEALDTALKTGRFECEYRYLTGKEEKTIWARGIVNYTGDEATSMHGTLMDITQRQKLIQELQEKEALYQQAEALTHIGNYSWDLMTHDIKWSDELYRIYGLEPRLVATDFAFIENFNHPDDTALVRKEIKAALEERRPFDFHYRIYTKAGELKVLHARGNLKLDAAGKPVVIIGTAQDVTEKQLLISRLSRNEKLYKQAEELANMGNWSWNIKDNKLEWTDQLYRIYGLEPQSEEITLDRFLAFVHPDDREMVHKGVEEMTTRDLLDYTFRIISADGKTKILRSVAQVQRDETGGPAYVVGTERDITDRQTLIDKLTRSQDLYKQAQALAHVGNWSWDIANNTIEGSDELYRILGLETPAAKLEYEEYLDFIHPDDREKLKRRLQRALETGESWDLTHKMLRKNGEIRIIHARGEVLRTEKGQPRMMVGTAQDVTEKQALIERLQESEKFYKQAQSLSKMGNWTMDLKTKEFSWSDEMYNIFETDRGEKIDSKKWAGYFLPEEREKSLQYLEECIRERKSYDRVHMIISGSGRIKYIHRKGELLYNEAGEPVKMIGTTQDITEGYYVQQELKENQTFIRKITDATPSIIASYNVTTGKYSFISGGLEKLLGYDTRQVMEQGVGFFADIIHPDDAAELMQKNAAALQEANEHPDRNDMVVEFSYRMRHKNGGYRWFHTYGTIFDRNSEGRVEHVLNISLDITEQKEAAQKIAEQQHFIEQIADASPTILYLYDTHTQSMAYINREIFFVLGYLPDEIVAAGSTITELVYHPEDYHLLPERKESSRNFQQVDSMIQYECRMRGKDGNWRWFLVREIVFKTDEQGGIKQILGAALDIHRRKEMEKTILQNTLQLEQSNASLEEFAYVASHDLKEPLRKISTFGDRLVATQLESLSPEGKLYLKKIVDASQRMQTMINDLLSISMITGNNDFEVYSLQKILDETLQTLEYKIEQQNAVVRSDALPEARIIPAQFRQLFQNLLSNSLKFVREEVQPLITIRYSLAAENEVIHYQLAQSSHYHKIEISDNGIGFENEFAGKIFAIFQRLHGRSEYEGSGIGLAICKKIVEHHGGVIYARGIPGEGATFTIILPA